MNARRHDPTRLDVAALASEAGALQGLFSQGDCERLHAMQSAPQDGAPPPISWRVRGEKRQVSGGPAQIWLHLQAQAMVWLSCQRCLQPVRTELSVDRAIRFVPGEDQAEALDAESEDDVLALARSLDLRSLIEDELLLALPIVPRHDACPDTAPARAQADATPAPAQSPFAALAALKSGRHGA
jgi:uncharacterized protein